MKPAATIALIGGMAIHTCSYPAGEQSAVHPRLEGCLFLVFLLVFSRFKN
jgi:hypothetical protein